MNQSEYRILVVDDEESLREVLTIMLHREGYQVESAVDGEQALLRLRETHFDLVISDIQMPRLDGLQLLSQVKEQCPETQVLMITAFSSTEEAVEAMKQGAYDYIVKPFKNEEIRLVVRNALERSRLQQENRALKKELGERFSFHNLIGKSKRMQEIYSLIERVAAAKTSILVTGESGTGKELVARAIHYNSPRQDKPFVAINCGAIPENLLESELFGHEKGAFTGASQAKQGMFEIAHGGTLFLDEIGELPMAMQVKLLRVLQEQEIRRIGGTRDFSVDVRLVAATNKDLGEEVQRGGFREDLYYRLNVIHLALPPLRERREDVPLLVGHFLDQFIPEGAPRVAESLMRSLLDYSWPGNIRELENVIERCVVLGYGDELTLDCLPPQMCDASERPPCHSDGIPDEGMDLDAFLLKIEQRLLVEALERTDGVRKKAAELLGISFRSIRYRLAKFGLGEEDHEEGV